MLAVLSGCHAGEQAAAEKVAAEKAAAEKAAAEKNGAADPTGEAGENKPIIDRKIASAMAAMRSEAREGSTGAQGTPPPNGILGPEGALRELPPGTSAQIVLGAEGAAPRVRLGVQRAIGAGPSGTLQLSYRSGGSVMPTVDLDFKAKTSAESVAGAAAGAAPSAPLATRFGFVDARPAADQPGRLPENARAEIAKLKGSWVDFVSAPEGGVLSQRFAVAGNNPVLQPLVQGSAVALSALELPYPTAPVGVGAYWMVKSRETAEGADVLAYRMVRLTELSQNVAHLTVSTRRYLITPQLTLQGLPAHHVRQFQSEGTAQLILPVGAAYPTSAEIKDQFTSLVSPDERPAQAMPVQSELTAKLTLTP
ncbi:MAG: hypothetical protein ABI895_25830 [Deltaproteobacteria bacterium]